MKRFGFGTMRLPLTEQGSSRAVDLEQTEKMLDAFLEAGFTYVDTAWMYHGHFSEDICGKLLAARYPRERFQLTTKFPAWCIKDEKLTPEEIFRTQLEKTGAGYFDYYLQHSVDHTVMEDCEAMGLWELLKEKKAQGLVKHIGVSFHDKAEVLDRLLTAHPELEVVQLQINYLDWEDETVQARLNYETAVKHGRKVIVMEPVRGGSLASNVPAGVERMLRAKHPDWSLAAWALRFVLRLPEVMMVLSGMSDLAQMQENLETALDPEPMSDEDAALLLRAAELYRKSMPISCTGCNYCGSGCPQRIPIPEYFAMYNQDAQPERGESYVSRRADYLRRSQKAAPASACIGCGSCENACPQHLPVSDWMKKVAEYFEEKSE